MIDKRYLTAPGNVVIEDEKDIDILKNWAKEAQANGSLLFAQISHPGRQTPMSVTNKPIGPSSRVFSFKILSSNKKKDGDGVKHALPIFGKPREMTLSEIKDVIERFTTTSKIVQKSGFSGIELHSAHGYLLSQFLSPMTNKRTDDYGGSLENRMRLLLQVIRSVREATGKDFPIGLKLNSADFQRGGFTEEESLTVIQALNNEGVDFLEISGGTYEQAAMVNTPMKESTKAREAYFLEFAQKARNVTKIPLILTGGFRSANVCASAVESNAIDFVGLARPFVIYPDKIKSHLLTPTIGDYVLSVPTISIHHSVDSGIQNLWYEHQIYLLSNKQPIDFNYSAFYPLTTGAFFAYIWNPRRKSPNAFKNGLIAFPFILIALTGLGLLITYLVQKHL